MLLSIDGIVLRSQSLFPCHGIRSVSTSIRITMSEYYKTKLNRWYHRRHSHTRLSIESSSGLGFGEGLLSTLSKMISEGPPSSLPLPDLDDIGCDLVDKE